MLENLAARVREDLYNDSDDWRNSDHYNTRTTRLALFTLAAALAHHGLLGDVDDLDLIEVDLSTVPTQHFVSLISNVKITVMIRHNVSGFDLLTLLESVKSEQLLIRDQSLGREETQALMRAMDSRLKIIVLYEVEMETLDKEALVKYSRRMKCRLEIELIIEN